MHPEFFTIPIIGVTVKTYGFFLMIGFLSAVWLAMRRAQRVKADPDCVLDLSFLALVFGVGGARAFYVVHYWRTDFADVPNKVLAIIDIRQGGLEFLGGFLGALLSIAVYLYIKRKSVRLYLDILAPGLMWGLAFGRIGCFFNGCCFGGLCEVPDKPDAPAELNTSGSLVQASTGAPQPKYPWAVRFPYGSPAQIDAWEKRRVTVPAELITLHEFGASLLPANAFGLSAERRATLRRKLEQLDEKIRQLRSAQAQAKVDDNPGGSDPQQLAKELQTARTLRNKLRREHFLDQLERVQKFPSRHNAQRGTSETELRQLASQCPSPYIHPTQLYSASHALILSGLLSAVFYRRKRHGVVIGLVFVLYPIGRVLLELIRADNPHDTLGLTVSQFVALAMFTVGVVYLSVLYKMLPLRSAA
ncbi:MAG: prolipoprotein diacylglyceryl transferase family protein [Phycisphaerae bacterium]